MARYRKIDTRIWNDEKFRSLSDAGKLAFLFVLTHPHMTSLGAMRGTVGGLVEELKPFGKGSGNPSERLSEGFMEAIRKGMLEVDEEASYVGAPNFLKYNGPESPNVVKSWESALDMIPECKLKVRLVERLRVFIGTLPEGFRKAFERVCHTLPEGFRKGMPNQEQEQEQEQEQDRASLLSPDGDETATEFFQRYQSFAKSRRLSVPASLTDERRKKISTRLKTPDWLDRFKTAIAHLPIPNDEKFTWQPDLDWLIANDTNVSKLAEGKYDRKATTQPPKPRRNPPTFHPDGSVTYDDDVS